MVEWREIGLVLVALYVLECVFWLRSGLVAFVSNLRAGQPIVATESGVRSFPSFGPWLPVGRRFKVQQLPFMLSPVGIQQGSPFLLVRSLKIRPFGPIIRFDELQSIGAEHRDLVINRERFARFATAEAARHVAQMLGDIRGLPAEDRAARIETWIVSRLDPTQAAARVGEFRRLTRGIRIIVSFQFLIAVVIVPALLWMLVSTREIWALTLLVWIALLVLHSFLFVRASRRLYPGQASALVQSLVLHTLAPVTVTRSYVHLSEGLLDAHEPLAVAKIVADPQRFRTLARHVLAAAHDPDASRAAGHDLDVSRAAAQEGEESEISRWFAERFIAVAERSLISAERDVVRVFDAPERRDPGAVSYCPRCHDQYVLLHGRCHTCDLPLEPLTEPSVTTTG